MKHGKLLSILSAALLGFTAAAFPPASLDPVEIVAEAATIKTKTTDDGNWKYSYESGKKDATIVEYLGTGKTPSIPSKIGDKTVKIIGEYAFAPQVNGEVVPKSITVVTIPSTVKEIGSYAFFRTNLKEIVIPSSVQTIGQGVFSECSKLKTLDIKGKALKTVAYGAFQKAGLTSVVLPSSVKTIRTCAFYECKSLKTVDIQGAAEIYQKAFAECTALTNVNLNENCITKYSNPFTSVSFKVGAFHNCKALTKINNTKPYGIDSNGEPYIKTTNHIPKLIQNVFMRSEKVKFINDYCTALCDYIVKTETTYGAVDDWMSEAVKARQLYDWLVGHCRYEDQKSGETNSDPENHTSSSVFLSYGLKIRGTGVGESVCEGYAKAYSMLLKAAGIESYVVNANSGSSAHAWNIVKISGRYYQCDPCWDSCDYWNRMDEDRDDLTFAPYGTLYLYFLKSDNQMRTLHHHNYEDIFIDQNGIDFHPYLDYSDTITKAKAALTKCNYSYNDTNSDGILDYDFDFNGTSNDSHDQWVLRQIAKGDMNLDGVVTGYDLDWCNQFAKEHGTHSFWLFYCTYLKSVQATWERIMGV